MENSFGQQQVLLKQGIDWLRKRQDTLVNNLAERMEDSPQLNYQHLPAFLRKLVAKDMLNDLIKRIESNSYDASKAQAKMVDALKKGATINSLVSSIELMVATITKEAHEKLISQPEVSQALLNKTNYFATLLKSSAATAMIEYEKSKMRK